MMYNIAGFLFLMVLVLGPVATLFAVYRHEYALPSGSMDLMATRFVGIVSLYGLVFSAQLLIAASAGETLVMGNFMMGAFIANVFSIIAGLSLLVNPLWNYRRNKTCKA